VLQAKADTQQMKMAGQQPGHFFKFQLINNLSKDSEVFAPEAKN
jgi:hypothetical protein